MIRRLFSTKYTKRKGFRKKETKKAHIFNVSRDLTNLDNIYLIIFYRPLEWVVEH